SGGSVSLYTESYWNGSNPTAVLKLDSTGNVGVGTDTPQGKLHITGSDDALRMTGTQPFLTFYDSVGYRSRIQGFGGDVTLETEGYVSGTQTNSYAVLRGNGSFCIGTRVADALLNVANVSSYNNGLKLSGNSIGGTGFALENTSAGGRKYSLFSAGSG